MRDQGVPDLPADEEPLSWNRSRQHVRDSRPDWNCRRLGTPSDSGGSL